MDIYINNWLLNKESLYDINIGDSVSKVISKIDFTNLKLVGTQQSGYYYLTNGFRFGFSNDTVDEIGIDLDSSTANVIFEYDSTLYKFRKKKK